ncbi:hypothetical protein CA265_14125 [Sphingobacteriaceae bacterium GW460-11-11-14-LB5]|nr:hypothetical protein CA265_14125 [Sphingobacteriaceae bacterium GW460-11-11-14-LB5]
MDNHEYLYLFMEKVIISCLLQGMNQKEISERLTELEMVPCSLSAIEKTIKKLKARHGAKTMFHLGAKIAGRK